MSREEGKTLGTGVPITTGASARAFAEAYAWEPRIA
jgi:hypothetical protein